jgi:hypothetical protein
MGVEQRGSAASLESLKGKRPELIIAFTADGLMHEFEAGAIVQLIAALTSLSITLIRLL